MSRYSLGLDIGSNSIGWALLDTGGQQIIDAGVRIFQEGVDRDTSGSEVSKNETRRIARGTRRSRQRRNYRKGKLLRMLVSHSLLPEDTRELQKVFDTDPYMLRAKGLEEQLSPYELGRVLYHLNQRRGFLSNRKTGDMKENSVVNKDATAIQENMNQAGCQTLGEYFSTVNPHEQRIRGHYTFRSMYEDEFEMLWSKQASYDGELLTDDLKRQIKDETIFFQRPLKWDRDTIGDCELETEHKRCPRANFFARRFRILQTVNNLIIRNPDGTEARLDDGQRQTVLDMLLSQKAPTFTAVRKKLNLMETQTFNLEEGSADKKNSKLKGDEFNAQLSTNKILGKKKFQALEQSDLIEINELIIGDFPDGEAISKLMEQHDFTEEQAIAAANISLPPKYANFSELAIQKLLPHMEKGLLTHDAIKEVYGDYQPGKKNVTVLNRLPLPEDLRNPIVNKALFETRKVINALLREYGKPESIYIEMARDVKGSKRERDELRLKQWKLEQENEQARESLREMGISNPSRNDLIKHKLWDECGRICPYTGKPISQHQLFGKHPEFQIEHILPYSRTLDDSYMNKTLCCVHENIDKGNQIPYEFYADSKPEQWEKILQRIARLPYPKRQRFWQKEVKLDSFIERQINDTRYITKEVVKYLKMLGIKVWGTKGQITSELRHQWGLNDILDFTGAGLKNRDDHRHHAVDAAVTAATNQKHLHDLADKKYAKAGTTAKQVNPPWPGFREQLEEKVNQINVSHRVTRKVSGQLHEETAYGPTGLKDDKGQDIFVYRKPLESLTLSMVPKIVDPVVRQVVIERLSDFGINPNEKGKIHKDVWKDSLYMITKNGQQGPRIRKVRLHTVSNNMVFINDSKGKPYRAVEPKVKHHIEIFEYTDKKGAQKKEGKIVSMLEAVQRSREGKRVICHGYGEEKQFLFSLSRNEMFMLEIEQGVHVLHRVQYVTLLPQGPRIVLRPHTYAAKVSESDCPPLIQRKTPNSLKGYKVTVDPIGRIFPAHD